MAFYHSIYGAVAADEDHYLAHRLAFVTQGDVMDLSRLSRDRNAEIASSRIRYASPRGVGMFQELSQVYGETTAVPHHQQSFDSDESFQMQNPFNVNQAYRSYPYATVPEATIPSHPFQSSSPSVYGSSGDLRQLGVSGQQPPMIGVQQGAFGDQAVGDQQQMTGGHPQHHDLLSVVQRPDHQWLVTTSNVDLRTLTPPSTVSSPHLGGLQGLYHGQGASPPPQQQQHHHMMGEDPMGGASAVIGHHPMHPRFGAGAIVEPPPLQRMAKRSQIPGQPPKVKGTPGRKRKVPDHDLTPQEATKRHIRRERNKVAAAKCRNRRRELTDRLQGETDHLEENQNLLHQEIVSLQQEKEHLEFILATHTPNCKARITPGAESGSLLHHDDGAAMMGHGGLGGMSELSLVPPPEILDNSNAQGHYYAMSEAGHDHGAPVSVITAAPATTSSRHLNATGAAAISLARHDDYPSSTQMTLSLDTVMVDEPLNTPVCTLATPTASSGIFTFPSTPSALTSSTAATVDTSFSFSSTQEYRQPTTPSSYSANMTTSFPAPHQSYQHYHLHQQQQQQQQQGCAAAHRRSSSSESHQSLESVQSPKLLAL